MTTRADNTSDASAASSIDPRAIVVGAEGSTLELAIAVWLDAKARRSNSRETASAYRETLAAFRRVLWSLGLDLDTTAPNPREMHPVALAAQAWAFRRADGVTSVAGSTANQRLAILSSFYSFAAKHRLLTTSEGLPLPIPNPISQVERAQVQAYGKAQALPATTVADGLAAIDRTTLAGKRDYALISLALETGHRATELSALTVGDLQVQLDHSHITENTRVTVIWQRTKGGKQMRDTLSLGAATALLAWINAAQEVWRKPLPERRRKTVGEKKGQNGVGDRAAVAAGPSHAHLALSLEISPTEDAATLATPATAPRFDAATPVFVSLSRSSRGHPLTRRALADIWMKYLHTSKVHATRHTFARGLEQDRADVSEIQARLGHENLGTTGRYLARLRSAENPHAAALERLFGITAADEQDLQMDEVLSKIFNAR